MVQPEGRDRHKTDRRDANALSEVLWVNRDRVRQGLPVRGLRRIEVPGAEDQTDRRLTSLRHDVGRELTRAINRIKAVLRRHNLQQDCPTKGIQTKAATKWLWQLSLSPEERLEMDQQLTRAGLLPEHAVAAAETGQAFSAVAPVRVPAAEGAAAGRQAAVQALPAQAD